MDIVTRLVHAGQETDGEYRSVSPPIYQTSTFRWEAPGRNAGFEYSRIGNPTRRALEQILAELEGGAGAVATASGMAAISTALSIFDAGVHVLCTRDCYGGSHRLLTHLARQRRIELSFVDFTDLESCAKELRPNSRVAWVETPSNPLLRITDLKALADWGHGAGLTVIADNTFLSPLLQRPLDFGADLVVHSTTKYLNGHADVVGGAVIAGSEELDRRIQFAARVEGGIQAPFDTWLVLRGIKTLALRMGAHEQNARMLARFLEDHPQVAQVNYPGLESHPGHPLAARQQKGFGAMISFVPMGGVEAARRVLASTRVFALAESLGGVESLIGHPATMSHGSMTPEYRRAAGIGDDLIRLSVGIEAVADLVSDLDQALEC